MASPKPIAIIAARLAEIERILNPPDKLPLEIILVRQSERLNTLAGRSKNHSQRLDSHNYRINALEKRRNLEKQEKLSGSS